MIAKKLGLSPEDLKSLMEKEEVRMLIKDFFMKLSEEHNDKHDDPKIPGILKKQKPENNLIDIV